MGRSALGFALSCLGSVGLGVSWPAEASAQASPPVVPGQGTTQRDPAPPPAAEPAPPLDPPPASTPTSGPAFLHAREEPAPAPTAAAPTASDDFLQLAAPWVDFSLTSFYLDARVGNFLNFGVQLGTYAFDRLRLSARFVSPVEETTDEYVYNDDFLPSFPSGTQTVRRVRSRSVSLVYGGTVGLIVTNSKSFVFGPSLGFIRTDVEDYGTAIVMALPFEWTTRRNLRVGFELALGHAVGGSVRSVCRTGAPLVSCGITEQDRPGGTAVVAQFYMGWALGRL